MMLRFTSLLGLLLTAGLCLAADAPQTKGTPKKQDATKETTKDKPAKAAVGEAAKSATHKVEKGPFKIDVSLKGILESEAMTEVLISPEVFTPDNRGQLRVLKAVEHGATVHKGDQLLWLDMERIDQIITDLERDRALADLAFQLAKEDLAALEKGTPLELVYAERGKKLSDEDLKRFLGLDKEFVIKMVNYQVKSAADYLTYAREELHHLEKMYKSNDLTESTEEIILKRQRDLVERATFYVKQAEFERDYVVKVSVPRREEGLKDSNVKLTLALEKTKTTLPLLLNQKRLTLDRMKFERQRTADKLKKFKNDRDSMVVKAPADGIVYFGKCVRGHWSSSGAESKLQRGGTLMPDEVILTIVKPRPLFVRATVDDKDFAKIKVGLKGRVIPTPLPDLKLSGKIDKMSAIPVAAGTFEARISLAEPNEAALVPGMACTVKVTSYQKADALAVPSKAVFTDENDDEIHYVFVAGKDDKHTKTYVTLGKSSGTRVEILQGLREGDRILLEKPAEKTKNP